MAPLLLLLLLLLARYWYGCCYCDCATINRLCILLSARIYRWSWIWEKNHINTNKSKAFRMGRNWTNWKRNTYIFGCIYIYIYIISSYCCCSCAKIDVFAHKNKASKESSIGQ